MLTEKLSIFIAHPSAFLTNCQPHGDGLIAYGFISRLAERGHTLHVAVPAMDVQGELPANIKLYPVPMPGPDSIAGRLEYMAKSRRLLNSLRRSCNIALAHQLNPVYRGLSLALVGAGVPVILGPFWPDWPGDVELTEEASSAWRRTRRSLKRLVAHLSLAQEQRQASALLVSTPAALSKLVNSDAGADKICTLPPGIDTTYFSPAPVEEVAESPSILYLANLWRRKGIYTLLDAFEMVAAALPSCRLVVAGSGPEQGEVERRIAQMPGGERITLLGNVERARIPEVMRRSTVYCLPSYGEPFGMSALEAMACGKPVVVTDAGGLAHLVAEQGGRKVPPGDATALAAALLEILRSPELQMKMGQYNRHLVETTYSWERVIDRLEAIYAAVLTAPGRELAMLPEARDSHCELQA